MRCIKQILEDQIIPLEWKVFDLRCKYELPGSDYDIYISTGGPGDPLDGDGKWDVLWYRLMDELYEMNKNAEKKKFVFLICHSFQMISHHWKLAEITKRKSTAFGIFPV